MAAPPSLWQLAVRDLRDGVLMWPLWMQLGWEDIRQRYRRSLLGPFWISLSMLVMVIGLGSLYSQIMQQNMREYFPFLTLGLVFWQLFGDLLRDGCQTFLQQEGFILQIKVPFSSHVHRVIWRQLVVTAHNIVIYVPVALLFQVWPTPATLLVIPGLALWVINAAWAILLLGALSTRFRDVPPLVGSLLQIVFFMSPILWVPATLGIHARLVELNPVYHFLELVRAPLMGRFPDPWSWAAALGLAVLGWGVTLPFFARFRARLAFWL